MNMNNNYLNLTNIDMIMLVLGRTLKSKWSFSNVPHDLLLKVNVFSTTEPTSEKK